LIRLERLAAVLLAAGFSRRMGGENKLLKPWRGRPLLAHAAEMAGGSGLAVAVGVIAPGDEAAAELLRANGVEAAFNARRAEGMASSIAAGVAAVARRDIDGAFILLGDMPLIGRDALAALAARFDPAAGPDIVAPACDGRRGHPVLFARRYFGSLQALGGDEGAASVIAAHPGLFAIVETGSPGVLRDFDLPSDFA
jgi:molybdenum cofactor cytidylyltransferase